jgi:ankyrin repeat protein
MGNSVGSSLSKPLLCREAVEKLSPAELAKYGRARGTHSSVIHSVVEHGISGTLALKLNNSALIELAGGSELLKLRFSVALGELHESFMPVRNANVEPGVEKILWPSTPLSAARNHFGETPTASPWYIPAVSRKRSPYSLAAPTLLSLQNRNEYHRVEEKYGYPPSVLHATARAGSAEDMMVLLRCGAKVREETNERGMLCLHQAAAAKRDDPTMIELLLRETSLGGGGMHDLVNAQDDLGRTVLIHAARANRVRILTFLLGTPNVDISTRAKNGDTALRTAIFFNRAACVEKLLEAGAKYTTAAEPARIGDVDGMNALLRLNTAHMTLNIRDKDGRTPLILAAQHNHPNVLKCLLQRGADLSLSDFPKSENGKMTRSKTALQHAQELDHFDCIQLLRDAGARR